MQVKSTFFITQKKTTGFAGSSLYSRALIVTAIKNAGSKTFGILQAQNL